MSGLDAAVIGTVFTDIKGFSAADYIPQGRNQGSVSISQGGVGRNVAENLANLGLSVRFVSSVDDGMLGGGVLSRLAAAGVDTAYIKKAPEKGMGVWMLINDKNGEQAGSLSQLPDPAFTEEMLDRFGEEIMAGVHSLVLETDMSEAVAQKAAALAEKHGKKIYALPATMAMVLKDPHILSRFECFICNHIEAGLLFHTQTDGLEHADMLNILKEGMKPYGIPRFVVTMGERGAVYCDARTGLAGFAPALKVNAADSSGAGDAFFSGTAAALMRGLSLAEAAACGTRLAALTIQSIECTCDAQTIREAGIL